MANLYLLVAVHFVVVVMVCGAFGYQFRKMYIENKIAEAELKACEYRTTHVTAEALKEIINR